MIILVRVDYNARILSDMAYLKWLISTKSITSIEKTTHLKHLMFIKSSSLFHNGNNNVILDFDLKNISSIYPNFIEDINCAFREVQVPFNQTTISDELKRISYALSLASEIPVNTIYMFTDSSNYSSYKSSPHLNNMNSVQVKSELDTIPVINNLWNKFVATRQSER